MTDGEDRRKLRTRTALLGAFVELLLEQGYETLAVGQVAQRANVGRSTLYEHFATKEALLNASLDGLFGALGAAAAGAADEARLLSLLDHVRSHAAVARLVLAQPLRSRVARQLAGRTGVALQGHGVPPGGAPLRAIALAEAQLAFIERWLAGSALPAPAAAAELLRLSRALAG